MKRECEVRRLPPLKSLPAFEISADRLSFSAAAGQLHVTHGAISRQIKALEDHLGVALFRRFNRRIELTAAGTALLPAVRQAMQLIEASASDVAAQTKRGPLVVSCLATFMMRWLIPRLHAFNAAHPGIEVRLVASHAPVDFGAGGIDVAIRLGKPPSPRGVKARAFLADRMGPVLSPNLLRERRIRRHTDLARLEMLHTETRPRAWSQWLATAGVKGVGTDNGVRFEHTYFLLEAAASGLGVAIGSYPLVEQDLNSGRLVAPFGFVQSGSSYHLLSPRMTANRARVAAFTEWLMVAAAA